ncbi:MAG: LptF/LptG family permease [Commensalibacter sp.]|nr:LptF/LptG family permease [Commensalibacter sp.]
MISIDLRSKNKKNFFAKLVPLTVDHYMITQAFPSFIISLSVILAALMLERLLVLLDLLAADSSPLGTFLGLLTDLIPHYLGLAIPAALCVSVFSTIRRISINNEIDALLSIGVSLFRCAKPFIIVGLIISLFSIILYGYIQPYARYDFRAAFYYASHAGWAPHIQGRMVVQPDNNLMMITNKADQHGTHLSGIFIRSLTTNDKKEPVEHLIVAKQGYFHMASDNTKVELDLMDGQIVTIRPNEDNHVTFFDKATRILKRNSKNVAFRERGDDEREMTLSELYHQMRHHTVATPYLDIEAEFHFRLTRALSIIFIPILATGLAVMKKRSRRNIGLAIAAIILVAYDHIQQFGADLIQHGHHSPLVALWLPFIFFGIICNLCLLQKSGFYSLYPDFLIQYFKRKSGKA